MVHRGWRMCKDSEGQGKARVRREGVNTLHPRPQQC